MNNDYNDLINKVRITGNYIDKLANIEIEMSEDIKSSRLEPRVKDILEKCMDEINEIYINSATLETRLNAIDEHNKSVDEIGKLHQVSNGTLKEELNI